MGDPVLHLAGAGQSTTVETVSGESLGSATQTLDKRREGLWQIQHIPGLPPIVGSKKLDFQRAVNEGFDRRLKVARGLWSVRAISSHVPGPARAGRHHVQFTDSTDQIVLAADGRGAVG